MEKTEIQAEISGGWQKCTISICYVQACTFAEGKVERPGLAARVCRHEFLGMNFPKGIKFTAHKAQERPFSTFQSHHRGYRRFHNLELLETVQPLGLSYRGNNRPVLVHL